MSEPSSSAEVPISQELAQLYPDFASLTPGQQRILGAALELFAEKGYAATSTGAIARQAGVAEGLIFKHFRSKKELLLRLARPLILEVFFPLSVRRIKQIIAQEHPQLETLLRALLIERLAFVRQHERLLRLVLQEILLHPELLEALQQQFQTHLQPLLERRFQHYLQLGQIREMPFSSFLRLVMSALMGLVIPRVLLFPDFEWQEETEIQQTLQTLVQGLAPATQTAFFQQEAP